MGKEFEFGKRSCGFWWILAGNRGNKGKSRKDLEVELLDLEAE